MYISCVFPILYTINTGWSSSLSSRSGSSQVIGSIPDLSVSLGKLLNLKIAPQASLVHEYAWLFIPPDRYSATSVITWTRKCERTLVT